MREGKPDRRSFIYRPRTGDDVRKHLQVGRLSEAIYRAHKRDAVQLIAFLRSDLPLSQLDEHRHMLADLLERFIQSKPRGRRGKSIPTAMGDMQALFVARCRRRLKRIRTRAGGKLPRGTIAKVMDEVAALMAEEGDVEGIDGDAAYQALLKQR